MNNLFVVNKGKIVFKKSKRLILHFYNNLTDDRVKVLILVYHRVLERAYFNPLYNIVTKSNFIKQVDEITKRYPVTTLTDIIRQSQCGQTKAKTQVVLTFDDGYCDNYDIVLPILRKKSLPAAFFLITDYINGNFSLWDWQVFHILSDNTLVRSMNIGNHIIRQAPFESRASYIFRILARMKPISFAMRHEIISALKKETKAKFDPPYEKERCMNWEEVKKISDAGMEIGSHSLSHRSLAKIPFEDAAQELKKSKEIIEQNINRECRHFSFPYGGKQDYNQRLVNYAKEAGYEACLLNVHGYNHLKKDNFCFRRIIMENETNINHLFG